MFLSVIPLTPLVGPALAESARGVSWRSMVTVSVPVAGLRGLRVDPGEDGTSRPALQLPAEGDRADEFVGIAHPPHAPRRARQERGDGLHVEEGRFGVGQALSRHAAPPSNPAGT